MVDGKLFRDTCGRFATGVMIVTGRLSDGAPVGVTVNSFSSVSLDPPLVLFCLDRNALSFDAFSMNNQFAFNVLGEHQRDISNKFASQSIDKYDGVKYDLSDNGVPILQGCLASIECQMHAVHEGGDHQIIVGKVIKVSIEKEERPLIYFKGAYSALR